MVKTALNPFFLVKISADTYAIMDLATSEISIAYLMIGDRKALLFDTVIGLGSIRKLVEEITALPVVVVLSHWHFDHVGSAHEFENIWGWPSHNLIKASRFGIPWKFLGAHVSQDFLRSVQKTSWSTRAFPGLGFFDSETSLDLGGRVLKVLHTPGHSDESICLYEESRGWLFAADTAYPGPLYLHFPESNPEKYSKSIQRLVGLKPKKIFPGHNSPQESSNLLVEIQNLLNGKTTKSDRYPSLRIFP